MLMKVYIDDRYRRIRPDQLSIAHTGYPLIMLEDKTFWSTRNGNDYYRYFDIEPGTIEFGGRSWLITHATRHVQEDGTSVIFLPTIGKYIAKAASDPTYKELNPTDSSSLEPLTVDGTTQFTNAKLRGVDLGGKPICYTNSGTFWRQSPSGKWQHALEDVPFRHALALKATNSGGRSAIFFFEIYSTPPAQRWLELFKRTQGYVQRFDPLATVAIKHQSVMYGFGQKNLQTYLDEINLVVDGINAIYRSQLPMSGNGKLHSVDAHTVSPSILNQLHHEFEAYGDRQRAGEFTGGRYPALPGLFSRLNNAIHASEAALGNIDASEHNAHLLAHVNFFPDIYESLTEPEYHCFTQDFKFGELLMGYHTLGKDFHAAFHNDDIELLKRREVRPQRISNTEIITYFGPTITGFGDRFREWWLKNNVSKYGYDIDDPANAVGLLPIGRLIGWRDVSEVEFRRELSAFTKMEWAIVFSTRYEV